MGNSSTGWRAAGRSTTDAAGGRLVAGEDSGAASRCRRRGGATAGSGKSSSKTSSALGRWEPPRTAPARGGGLLPPPPREAGFGEAAWRVPDWGRSEGSAVTGGLWRDPERGRSDGSAATGGLLCRGAGDCRLAGGASSAFVGESKWPSHLLFAGRASREAVRRCGSGSSSKSGVCRLAASEAALFLAGPSRFGRLFSAPSGGRPSSLGPRCRGGRPDAGNWWAESSLGLNGCPPSEFHSGCCRSGRGGAARRRGGWRWAATTSSSAAAERGSAASELHCGRRACALGSSLRLLAAFGFRTFNSRSLGAMRPGTSSLSGLPPPLFQPLSSALPAMRE